MAAPIVFDSLATNPGGTGSTLTVNLSTHAADDILLIFLPKTGNAAWTVPAGWLAIDQRSVGNSSNGVHGSWFARQVLTGDTLPLADPVCTLGATVTRAAVCRTIRGGSLEGIFVAPAYGARGFSTGTGNPVRPPSITTLAPEMLALHCYGQRSATDAPDPTDYTQDEEVIISGTLVMNASRRTVADQNTTLANQDASPTSGARWVAGIICIPSADYPYYRAGSQATTASGTSVTPVKPAGTTNSDVLGNADVMIATVEGSGSTTLAATDTGLWTEIGGAWSGTTSGGGSSVKKFWAKATATPNMQFTRTGTGEISACITTYYGCDQTNPIGTFDADARASSTTSTFDAITRTVTKVLVQATCVADAVPTFTSPSGWIERMDGLGIACSDQIYNAIGSSASASFTLSSASPTLVGLLEIIGLESQGPTIVTPTTAALTLATFAPTLKFTTNVTPATIALTSATFAPSLKLTITPNTNALTLTAFAPSIRLGVTPATASLSLTAFAPALSETVTPSTLSLSLTSFAPSIVLTNHITVTPATRSLVLSTFVPITEPPQIVFIDPGGDAVQAIGYFNSVSANGPGISFDTSQKFVGVGSYKFNSGANLATVARVDGILGGPRRVSCRFRFDATHTSARRILQISGTGGIVFKVALSAGASPVLQLLDFDNNATSGSTPLAIDTWHRIGLAFNGAANNLDVKLFLDAVEEVSVNLDNTDDSTPLHLQYGWIIPPGTDKLCWFDQIYVDDGSDLTDPNPPPLTAKTPGAVNDDNFDTTGGTGAVNERPLSETNFRQHAASTQVSQNYTLQTAGTGDIDLSSASIGGYMGWVWAKKSEAGGSHSLTLNGSDHPIQLTTSPALHWFAVTGSGYPDNVAGIGLVSGGSAADTFLYECGAVIAFTPSENVTVTPSIISLTISTFAPVLETQLTPDTVSLTLTTLTPQLSLVVTPATATLSLSTFASTLHERATPSTQSLTLSSFALTLTTSVVPATSSLTLASFAPTVLTPVTVIPDTTSLTTQTFAVKLAESLTLNAASLTLTEFAPSLNSSVTPSAQNLVSTTFAPSLQTSVTPSFAALTLTAFAPTINVEAGVIVVPNNATLTLNTFALIIGQSVTAVPEPATLVINSFASSLSTQTTPAPASLTTTTSAPSLRTDVVPSTVNLTLVSFTPVVGTSVTVTPSTFALSLSSFTPSLNFSITPATNNLTTTAFAANLLVSVSAVPQSAALVLTTFAPAIVGADQDVTVVPSTISLVLTTYAPNVRRFRSHGQENISRENRTIAISLEGRNLGISFENRVQ